jgi:hypothetical protein
MIVYNSAPTIGYPCIVQINYPTSGNIGFYKAKDVLDAEQSYLGGKIVAIFKPKHQSSYTPDPKEPS